MKIAVFGCLHGQLNDMFYEVDSYEKQNHCQVDLIIVCGDCQTIRHHDDLICLAVPKKYQRLGDFHDYYSGVKKVPRLTIFVGGNHEASNYLMSLPYGGWVCNNFYYLGYSGVVRYRGLRIAGISGIYNSYDCNRGRFETLPLDDGTKRSIYHTRRLEIFRLSLLSKNINPNHKIDIFMSHDWPARVYQWGKVEQLLQYKPYFRRDIESRNGLGNPMTQPLIEKLKPRWWFAAHLHCMFKAKIPHNQEWATEFLSLSKIKRGQRFKEFLTLNPTMEDSEQEKNELNKAHHLQHDMEWLTILRKTAKLESNSSGNVYCPNPDDEKAKPYYPTNEEIEETREMMMKTGGLQIKENFRMSEPVIYNREDGTPASVDSDRTRYYPNPQHIELCYRLGIKDLLLAGFPSDMLSVMVHDARGYKRVSEDTDDTEALINSHLHAMGLPQSSSRESGDSHLSKRQAIDSNNDKCVPIPTDEAGGSR